MSHIFCSLSIFFLQSTSIHLCPHIPSYSREELKEKYGDKLQPEIQGSLHEVFSKVMRAVVGKKVTVPGSYKGCATCSALSPLTVGVL